MIKIYVTRKHTDIAVNLYIIIVKHRMTCLRSIKTPTQQKNIIFQSRSKLR